MSRAWTRMGPNPLCCYARLSKIASRTRQSVAGARTRRCRLHEKAGVPAWRKVCCEQCARCVPAVQQSTWCCASCSYSVRQQLKRQRGACVRSDMDVS